MPKNYTVTLPHYSVGLATTSLAKSLAFMAVQLPSSAVKQRWPRRDLP